MLEDLVDSLEEYLKERVRQDDEGPASEAGLWIARRLDGWVKTLKPREVEIVLLERGWGGPGGVGRLNVVGEKYGISRERARQLQARLKREVRELAEGWVERLAEEAGSWPDVCSETEWYRTCCEAVPVQRPVAKQVVWRNLPGWTGYRKVGGVFASAKAAEAMEGMRREAARQLESGRVVDLEGLLRAAEDGPWAGHAAAAEQALGLERAGRWGARRMNRLTRTHVALLEMGRPATREELAEMVGISPRQAGGNLTAIPEAIRVDVRRWKLREKGDREWKGISAELQRRIEEAGGETGTRALVEGICSEYSVTEKSVQMFMHTERYVVEKGRIRMRRPDELEVAPLAEVVDGRDADGVPWWGFTLKAHHLQGYSASHVPQAVAKALGCRPDGVAVATVVNMPEVRPWTVRWRLRSATKAEFGYMRETLLALKAKPECTIRVGIVGPGQIRVDKRRGVIRRR